MTPEEQEKQRQEYLNEKGTEPPCPFCKVARVKRSDYIRCLRCGVNWIDGENLDKDPRVERKEKFLKSMNVKETKSGDKSVE